jgi:tRNA (cmo5U34)-methyltransferase
MDRPRGDDVATLEQVGAKAARDRVFAEKIHPGDFSFTPQVAQVFDDMVSRSVPFYGEMQRMTTELAAQFAQDSTNLYDLGCATGTTLALLDAVVSDKVRFVGIDNAPSMLHQARAKLDLLGSSRSFSLVCADLHDGPRIENASAVIMTLTLQFVRPLHRERIIREIFEGMTDKGCLIIFEKLVLADSLLNRLFIEFYYEMKRRNGYSDVEITRKREALENVLVPYRVDENVTLLRDAGFRQVDEFFRWYNFCGLLAVK